jgi:CRISPR-associated protein Cmr3
MGKPRQRQNQKPSINPDKQKRKQEAEIKRQQLESEKQMMPQKCPDGTVNLQFTPMDTWFFRESRPHDAVGASELSSLFPPPVKTLLGAVRTFLGDSMGFNWNVLKDKNKINSAEVLHFKSLLGDAENLKPLSVNGAWVCKDGQRLYPVPCYLMHKLIDNEYDFIRLEIGDVVECDLGKVRLPQLPKLPANKTPGYKGLEQTWITHEGWQKLLAGGIDLPVNTKNKKEIFTAKDLFDKEPRLGIARNNQTRTVIEGKLYQTQHLRLKEDVYIEIDLKGLHETLRTKLPMQKNELLRLGGEGRMAGLTAKNQYEALPKLKLDDNRLKKFILNFITPAYFGEENHQGRMFPENFTPKKNEKEQIISWEGKINDITFIVEAAVIGKVHREGGWNMQDHKPRAVKSYIPAGSAWFCRLDDESLTGKEVIEKLNGQCIGEETDWGRGQILIGVWHDTAKTEEN